MENVFPHWKLLYTITTSKKYDERVDCYYER